MIDEQHPTRRRARAAHESVAALQAGLPAVFGTPVVESRAVPPEHFAIVDRLNGRVYVNNLDTFRIRLQCAEVARDCRANLARLVADVEARWFGDITYTLEVQDDASPAFRKAAEAFARLGKR